MPQAIPQEGNVPIRGILAPALATLAQKFQQGSAAKNKQRPYHFAKGTPLLLKDDSRMNARETPNAGAAKNAQQDGFGLIVERVRGGNLRDASLACELAKKVVAQCACCPLDSGRVTRGDGRLPYMKIQPML